MHPSQKILDSAEPTVNLPCAHLVYYNICFEDTVQEDLHPRKARLVGPRAHPRGDIFARHAIHFRPELVAGGVVVAVLLEVPLQAPQEGLLRVNLWGGCGLRFKRRTFSQERAYLLATVELVGFTGSHTDAEQRQAGCLWQHITEGVLWACVRVGSHIPSAPRCKVTLGVSLGQNRSCVFNVIPQAKSCFASVPATPSPGRRNPKPAHLVCPTESDCLFSAQSLANDCCLSFSATGQTSCMAGQGAN